MVQELTQRLEKLGIYEFAGNERLRLTEQEKSIMLKMAIAGAFYPNFFATAPINNPMVERDVYRSLNGRDPRKFFCISELKSIECNSIKFTSDEENLFLN